MIIVNHIIIKHQNNNFHNQFNKCIHKIFAHIKMIYKCIFLFNFKYLINIDEILEHIDVVLFKDGKKT